jgi:hypothetical protein
MKRTIALLAVLLLSGATLGAQNQAALAILAQLDTEAARAKPGTTRNTIRELLADLRVLLEMPIPPPVCPPPVVCPTCPPPVVCPGVPVPVPDVDCVVAPWGAWSAWTPITATDESRTRTRTVVTPESGGGAACPALTETETRPIIGPVIQVAADTADLLAKIQVPGDYRLLAGQSYVGNFTFATPGVRLYGAPGLPAARVTAGATAAYALTPSDRSRPVVLILASDVTVEGITFVQGQTDRPVVQVGSGFETDPLKQPTDVTLDRIEVTASALGGGKRGIELHARAVTVSRSLVLGFWWVGQDSQAIYACNGPGPYTIIDNELQASGENVMFGGDSIRSPAMIPSGRIAGNLLYKPQAWRTNGSQVKNLLELKAGDGVVIEDNVLDGNWAGAQVGNAILFTPRNQNNDSPWTVVQNVVFRRNILKNHTNEYAISILGMDNNAPSRQTANISIEGNLFLDSPKGIQTQGVAGHLRIVNNSFLGIRTVVVNFVSPTVAGSVPLVATVPIPLTMTGNVIRAGIYGLLGQSGGLATYTVSPVITGNVVETGTQRTIWPTGNTLLANGTLAALLDAQGHYTADRALGW